MTNAKHRNTSRRRMLTGAGEILAAAAVTAAVLVGVNTAAHASTRAGQCWPMAMRWQDGQHAAMCVPMGGHLEHWQWTLTASQKWEREMHYLACWRVGRQRPARGLVFTCERQPAPSWWPGPRGMWTVTDGTS